MKYIYIFFLILMISFIACDNAAMDSEGGAKSIKTVHRFRFENTANDSVAVLIDGRMYDKELNDSVVTTLNAEVQLVDINNSKINNELIAVNAHRKPVLIEDINWNRNIDTTVTFVEQKILEVTGWVIYTGNQSFEYVQNRILRAMQDCNTIYAHEGTGLQFSIKINDVSLWEGIDSHYNLATLEDMDEVSKFLEAEKDQINLFFTKTVAGNTQGAYTTFLISESDNHLAFGIHAVNGGTIAHEIAHTLTLLHYDTKIGIHNVMVEVASQARVYFTEGQIYQMWYKPASALYTVYGWQNPQREQNPYLEPDPYLSVWDEAEKPPYFELFFDNDNIE